MNNKTECGPKCPYWDIGHTCNNECDPKRYNIDEYQLNTNLSGINSYIMKYTNIIYEYINSNITKPYFEFILDMKNLGGIEKIDGNKIIIKQKEWAPGIWAGAEGFPFDLCDKDNNSLCTVVVTDIDMENKTIIINANIKQELANKCVYCGPKKDQPEECQHDWVWYHGFTDSFEYCKKCDKRR